ncbi:MAG: hypothetical protein J0J01_19890 [Reyranella sp.]|nr:hypothetical protein [Reyranella sp.]MBN9089174.1 hypothetical protein [Reyranella sp.]
MTFVSPSASSAGPSVSASTSSSGSHRLSDLAVLGGLMLTLGLALITRFSDFRSAPFLLFLFMIGAGPILAAGILAAADGRLSGALLVLRSGLLALLAALIVDLAVRWGGRLAGAGVAALGGLWAYAQIRRGGFWSEATSRLDAGLLVLVALGTFLLSPFDPQAAVPVGLLDYAVKAPQFSLWLALGIAWTALGLWLRQREGWAFIKSRRFLAGGAVVLAGVVILLMYDDTHFVDFGHYVPSIGPAVHALRGGVPMVDVYSVYGFLPWFVYRLVFAIFEPAFGPAAVLVRLINLAYFALLFATLLVVTRRWVSAAWFFVPALLIALCSHVQGFDGMWNLNALPMTMGGRYLIPAAMTLTLAWKGGQPVRAVALPLIGVAALSSIEILAFALAPWGLCVLCEAIRRRSPRYLLQEVAWAIVDVGIAQAILIGGIRVIYGRWVDYGPYFSLFFQFRPAEESIWSVTFPSLYALWFPIGLVYFLVIAVAMHRAFRLEPSSTLVERLLPVASLGMGPLTYFFGRPQEGTLNVVCLPFAVVAIAVAQRVFVKPQRFGPAGPVLRAVLAVTFAFITADAFEHFMRPLDPSRGNSSILRRCLSPLGCRLDELPRHIGLALHTDSLDRRTSVSAYVFDADGTRPRIEEARALVRRWGADDRQIALLADRMPNRMADSDAAIGLTTFMASGQWYPWSISAPIIDGASRLVEERTLARVSTVSDGLLVILPNEEKTMAPLNAAVLKRLRARCELQLLERGRYLSAFHTQGCMR